MYSTAKGGWECREKFMSPLGLFAETVLNGHILPGVIRISRKAVSLFFSPAVHCIADLDTRIKIGFKVF